jgi:DNA-binding GntR family transcriptional regulator
MNARAGVATATKACREEADIDARIYQSIFDGVLNHRLTPGTKLPEPEPCGRASCARKTRV